MDVERSAHSTGADVTLKLDCLQVTGSFKPRAHAARVLGHAATIFVPETSPAMKIDRVRATGADVRVIPGFYPEALAASEDEVERTGALFAHAYDQPEIVAGQGTCGRELDMARPDLDTVLVAVGGGGLIAGIAGWYGGSARVVAVETVGSPTLHAARLAGEPVDVEVGGLAVSSLGARRVGRYAWEAARRWVDDAVLVTDEDVLTAMHCLWEAARVAAEPGGAAAFAALTSGAYRPTDGERVGVVVCGANLDPSELGRRPSPILRGGPPGG